MATNIYDFEEKWFFDPQKPDIYYGWGVTFASGHFSLAHFKRPERRKEMAEAVKKAVPILDDFEAELLAFVLLYKRVEEDEVYFLLDKQTNEAIRDEAKANELREIAEDFALNYE